MSIHPSTTTHRIKENELLEQISTLDADLHFTKGEEESSIVGCVRTYIHLYHIIIWTHPDAVDHPPNYDLSPFSHNHLSLTTIPPHTTKTAPWTAWGTWRWR